MALVVINTGRGHLLVKEISLTSMPARMVPTSFVRSSRDERNALFRRPPLEGSPT